MKETPVSSVLSAKVMKVLCCIWLVLASLITGMAQFTFIIVHIAICKILGTESCFLTTEAEAAGYVKPSSSSFHYK